MNVVTISSRYQVVIPKQVRELLGLKPGQKVVAIPFRGRVELVPVRSMESARGMLDGLDTDVPRDADRV